MPLIDDDHWEKMRDSYDKDGITEGGKNYEDKILKKEDYTVPEYL